MTDVIVVPTDLDKAKIYLRIDADFVDEDDLIQGLVDSAQAYIKNTTGKVFADGGSLYGLAVKMLVTHWYDNRGAVSDKPVNDLPNSFNAIIMHLALCGEYE